VSVSPPEPPVRQRGDRISVRLEAMVHGGACLARDADAGTVLVDGGIPGEVVEVELTHRRKRTWFARVTAVSEPSPFRVTPPCPYVPSCGGCQLQHVAYAHQLTLKRGIVEDAMRRQEVALAAPVRVHGMDDPWRYRWRGEFHVVRDPDGGVQGLGFNRLRSWTPIAVADCLIHHPTITNALPALVDAARTEAADTLSLLHLTVGDDGRELLVLPKPAGGLGEAAIAQVARGLPEATRSLALVVDDPDAPAGVFTHWVARPLDSRAGGLGGGEPAPSEGRDTSQDRKAGFRPMADNAPKERSGGDFDSARDAAAAKSSMPSCCHSVGSPVLSIVRLISPSSSMTSATVTERTM